MPNLTVLIERGEICQCLRNKQMYYDPGPLPNQITTGVDTDPGMSGPYWCALTQSILGPDGQVADTESCRSGRMCCQLV